MVYPWPVHDVDPVLQEALDIAMDYLEYTGQAFPYPETQKICANTILESWWDGEDHKIRLANYAIVAVERKTELKVAKQYSFFPRIS